MSGAADCSVLNQVNENIKLARVNWCCYNMRYLCGPITINNKNNVHHLIHNSWVLRNILYRLSHFNPHLNTMN